MTNFINTALVGLSSFQQALATASHNIANVGTDGYSRQRVNLAALPADNIGGNPVGRGVHVNGVQRMVDQLLVDRIRTDVAERERLDAYTGLSHELDRLLGSAETGLAPALADFFSGIQTVADDPASITSRQALLSQAGTLVDRVGGLQRRLEAQQDGVEARLGSAVQQVNALATSIAELNVAVLQATDAAGGNPPNDLLDQRDLALRQLAEQVSVEVIDESDGSINVLVGNGQPLVLGSVASELRLVNGAFGAASTEVALVGQTGTVPVARHLGGGAIGGLLDFQRETLDPSRNALGRLAVALADAVNGAHREGMDLNGALGDDFFALGDPLVVPAQGNGGVATLAATVADVGALTVGDYVLGFDGTAHTLLRRDTEVAVPFTGTGTAADPFVADGLELVLSGAMAAGDSILVRPTNAIAGTLDVAVVDPATVAAAAPVVAAADAGNAGTARVVDVTVINHKNAELLDPATIDFVTATSYRINGGGVIPYVPGQPIERSGWSVLLEGAPAAGDAFAVSSNSGGVGDNRNALALSDALERGVLGGGSTSVRDAYAALVSEVSTGSRQAEINLTAQASIAERSMQELQVAAGVNLDEEAANLLRFQQAYQASAQVIAVADTMFQVLIGAVRR